MSALPGCVSQGNDRAEVLTNIREAIDIPISSGAKERIFSMVSTAFDQELMEHPHFCRYPSMLPFVGSRYVDPSHKRVLLLAESHYWHKEDRSALTPAEWYDGPVLDLRERERRHINTREIVLGTWPGQTKMFRNYSTEMTNAGFQKLENYMAHVAFMNTFQRPAHNATTFCGIEQKQDIEEAINAVTHVINTLKPNFVCFASEFAWKKVGSQIELIGIKPHFEHTSHATCPWWHRKTKGGVSGREKFLRFLKRSIVSDGGQLRDSHL